jgi:hypothetical protein
LQYLVQKQEDVREYEPIINRQIRNAPKSPQYNNLLITLLFQMTGSFFPPLECLLRSLLPLPHT